MRLLTGRQSEQRPDLDASWVSPLPRHDAYHLLRALWVHEYAPGGAVRRAFLETSSPIRISLVSPYPDPSRNLDQDTRPAHRAKWRNCSRSGLLPYYDNVDGGHLGAGETDRAPKRNPLGILPVRSAFSCRHA